ncbi:alpha/beta hydrolase [Rhodococcus sp. SGAir0479]|uniref:alpha/beta hydrolase n=1 Tax=Rhodococcus sp. SGAir0479 TaxID=2567884 RepID=UPI0010CCE4F3|nr:alpha/beta hydrolase family protein [Rhodococcus sp. SGAir0479]QCQ92094.1 esterase family protein [Rhodococcus sp. SGAir0479]
MSIGRPGRVFLAALSMAVLAAGVVGGASTAGARPASHLVGVDDAGPLAVTAQVYSASMDRVVPVRVQRPADSGVRPTLYLLNGAGGGETNATWQQNTDVVDFFADKNVNVVTPMDGAASYYTDWERDDPALGRSKWQTFLTRELPPIIDGRFGGNGVNSIAAISMTATSVLNLAISAPGLYRAVGSYSGCAETSSPMGSAFVDLVVRSAKGADPQNMWGPRGGPGWVANDPVINAEKLRGTALYISSGSGLPGPYDNLAAPGIDGDLKDFARQVFVGGAIEAATNLCTRNLANRLQQLNIPATFDFAPTGSHSWRYWQDDLHQSWPTLAGAMGV